MFYAATAILGAAALTVFGHKRILAMVVGATLLVTATLLGRRLVIWGRRVPVPGGLLLSLLIEPGSVGGRAP